MSVIKARFFCENCHTEVRAEDKVCPACGRFFGLVRCPRCNFTGESYLFRRGCPSCGYIGGHSGGKETGEGQRAEGLEYVPLEDVDPDLSRPGNTTSWLSQRRLTERGRGSGTDLPGWFYRISAAILFVLLFYLLLWFLNLL